ncbi:MAG: spondin domain-containing protein [Geminicoccales bacterium]
MLHSRFGILSLFALILPIASAQGQETANYRLSIMATWSPETHPFDFPPGPTFSHLIGATHNDGYTLFKDGDTGSSGLELIAERGRVSIFRIELEEANDRELIGSTFEGNEIEELPGETTLRFSATAAFPLVSFATMIAPSPDWITGVSAVLLRDGDRWIDRLELPLWAWDAGTDSGDTYLAPNQDTQPQQSVRLVATPHFLTDRGLLKVGDVVIERFH